ncbi:MAG: PEGA domain-containing protein, partial [Muribaculaceae bacterium]|nr:PEGA domain-containing protein [Muribaculaceae bacterium]
MKNLFLTILLVVATVVTAAAQKAEVESFEATPMDVTAQQFARLDLHGEKCAVVKVRVIADGVAFQGNLIGEPVEKPGEYWVYLTDGTKQFQILSRSFLPFMYNFDEPLKGGVTYVLTLLAPQPAAGAATPQRKKQNFLVLKVTPPTAHVTVDGTEIEISNGVARKLLPAGTHAYRVTAPGYAPHEETVTIGEDKVSRTVALRSVKPKLTVTATTPGTEIFVNEVSRGTDRWSGELLSDSYVVEGRLAGHRANSQTVALADNESRTVTIPVLTPIMGTLSIDYEPVDATVTIDDRAAGTTPLLLDDILVGTHRVTISAP